MEQIFKFKSTKVFLFIYNKFFTRSSNILFTAITVKYISIFYARPLKCFSSTSLLFDYLYLSDVCISVPSYSNQKLPRLYLYLSILAVVVKFVNKSVEAPELIWFPFTFMLINYTTNVIFFDVSNNVLLHKLDISILFKLKI